MKILAIAAAAVALSLSTGAVQAQTAAAGQTPAKPQAKAPASKSSTQQSSAKQSSTQQSSAKQSSAKQSSAKQSSTKQGATKQSAASKRVPSKTAKAVEANTPVETLSQRLSDKELQIARTIHTGRIQCELGADVTVTADEKNPGFFHVSAGKQRYYMHPVESRTGAIRMEDNRAGAMWLQLGNKSMLMNQKLGQRVADECVTPAQREFAAQLQSSGQPGLLDGPAR